MFKFFQLVFASSIIIGTISSCSSDSGPTDTEGSSSGVAVSSDASSSGLNSSATPLSSGEEISSGTTFSSSVVASSGDTPSSEASSSSSSTISSSETQISSENTASSSSVDLSDRLANITRSCSAPLPSMNGSTQRGWGSRYWDCCKPSCAWPEKFDYNAAQTVRTCDINNNEIATQVSTGNQYWPYEGVVNACGDGGDGFACYDQTPFAVCDSLAYGYAAASGATLGDAACGSCFLLEFDGGMHQYEALHEHRALQGKKMIVMVTNIGYDVEAGQFDIMIPGGGMGVFTDGCRRQWGVSDDALVGATYGGFRTTCENQLGYYPEPSLDEVQTCVRDMCDGLFNRPGLESMLEGCYWYVDWYYAANNPTYTYRPIECPQELIDGYSTNFPVHDMSGY